MTQDKRSPDKGLLKSGEIITRPLPPSGRRAISLVERSVSEVLARLPADPSKRLLVALSGGPDSVAALYAIHRIRARFNFGLAAAHLNHGLREGESNRDEEFVRDLCGRLGVELSVERIRGLTPVNLEERARELRYRFLNRAADAVGAHFIVLGHHRDDQAETVLLRLLRGAGIAGLSAMAKVGPGRLVRPLLDVDRATILVYLAALGAKYVFDSSNLETRALRNRVRANLLPHLAGEYSPGISRRLAELASEMNEADSFIKAEAGRSLDKRFIQPAGPSETSSCRMDVRGFETISPALAHTLMRELIARGTGGLRKIGRIHIDAMYRLATGVNPSAGVSLPGGWRLRREYDDVVLEHLDPLGTRPAAPAADGQAMTLTPGVTPLDAGQTLLIMREITLHEPSFPAPPWHPRSPFEAYFDAEAAPALAVRRFQAGDRIRPLGLCGSRKVQDVFVDHKVTVSGRRCWPLVVCGAEVVWIPGLVRSRVALVTAASKKVLYLRADFGSDRCKGSIA